MHAGGQYASPGLTRIIPQLYRSTLLSQHDSDNYVGMFRIMLNYARMMKMSTHYICCSIFGWFEVWISFYLCHVVLIRDSIGPGQVVMFEFLG